MKRLLALALLFPFLQSTGAPPAAPSDGNIRHVVVIVWDGMRPDFVTEKNTPALFLLSRRGVFFKNHHPVFVSSTEVNGAAIATGDYPCNSRVVANREYRPEIDPLKSVAMESMDTVRKAAGTYPGAKTVPEILQANGFSTIVAGTKPVAILIDPAGTRAPGAAARSVNLISGTTFAPSGALEEIVKDQGPFPPEVSFPNEKQDNWTAKALTDTLWKDALPAFSLLWMSDPDYTQHQMAPGSEPALAAIRSNDTRLASVLAAIEAKGATGQTDVFVVSDHGFSTISKALALQPVFAAAGLNVSYGAFKQAPRQGEIMAIGLGGSVLFYVIGHDAPVTKRLVDCLQQSDFAGVIFTRDAMEGTFGLDQARLNAPEAPDVVLSLHWNAGKNKSGAQGQIEAFSGKKEGQGMHGSLSRFDMHNTLIAAGPDFKKGMADTLPTGNVDLAPTILKILGVAAPAPMDGRVLTEALAADGQKPPVKNFTLEAKRDFEKSRWRQYLDVSQAGSTIYINEGNGGTVQGE